LGAVTKVDSIEVRWPSGLVERFGGLPADKIHVLKEEAGIPAESPVKKDQ